MEKSIVFQWMEAAMASDLPSSAKHVFMVIAKRYNVEKGAFPSYTKLSKDTGLSKSTVERAVKTLVNLGWLVIHKEVGRVNHYTPTTVTATNVTVTLDPSYDDTGTHVTVTPPPRHHDVLMTKEVTNSNDQPNDQEETETKERSAFKLHSLPLAPTRYAPSFDSTERGRLDNLRDKLLAEEKEKRERRLRILGTKSGAVAQ